MQQCLIQFQGFHASDETKNHFEEVCQDILSEAPHGATLSAVVRKKDHEFCTHITVHSRAGRFFGLASDRNLYHALKVVFQQVDKQIHKWQTVRHHRSVIRAQSLKVENQEVA